MEDVILALMFIFATVWILNLSIATDLTRLTNKSHTKAGL